LTRFDFALKPEVIKVSNDNTWKYQLRFQKQAGTINIPLALRIQLPDDAHIVSSNPSGTIQDDFWLADLTLRTDLEIHLEWKMP
jgi:hypothetical protein